VGCLYSLECRYRFSRKLGLRGEHTSESGNGPILKPWCYSGNFASKRVAQNLLALFELFTGLVRPLHIALIMKLAKGVLGVERCTSTVRSAVSSGTTAPSKYCSSNHFCGNSNLRSDQEDTRTPKVRVMLWKMPPKSFLASSICGSNKATQARVKNGLRSSSDGGSRWSSICPKHMENGNRAANFFTNMVVCGLANLNTF
jgi:hypothetical protein